MLYDSVDNYCHTGLDDNSVRMTKHDELSDFSSQSILCAMDRFVKAVNNMNETVMVPCRLLDMDVEGKATSEKVPALLRRGGSPYSFYSVLNSVKNDLIWGPTSNDEDDNDNSSSTTNNTRWSDPVVSSASSTTSNSSSGHVKGHMRRQSTLSMISMSSNASDGESEGGCDGSEGGDSGVEAEDMTAELTTAAVTNNLRTHLLGLHTCLSNLTDTAAFITERYQEEVNV